jgi:hypothetical protein
MTEERDLRKTQSISFCVAEMRIFSAAARGEAEETYANPTPATTGSSERIFILLNEARRTRTEIMMVKRGVAARTT